MRNLSRRSIAIATRTRLVTIDPAAGTVYPLSTTVPKSRVADSIRPLVRNAEKLGTWCAAITLTEIASILKVRF
jgi:hypothetical protein